ncbi:helix-turn-helix domain-containing protein [bacterium]|nr:helix-turn-helix domain-containing protein [bacterium]
MKSNRTAGDVLTDLRARRKAARISMAVLASRLGPGWTQSIISERERGLRQTTLTQLDEWRSALAEIIDSHS